MVVHGCLVENRCLPAGGSRPAFRRYRAKAAKCLARRCDAPRLFAYLMCINVSNFAHPEITDKLRYANC